MSIKHFLWICSGANIELLQECKNDHNKYANIGATILMTALLAWVSMGFALYSVFGTVAAAAAVGLIWAIMIFVLDRTIVTSMRKPRDMNVRNQGGGVAFGRSGGFFAFFRENLGELFFTAIRFVVALLISFVITKPLEIKIFEDRLTSVLNDMKNTQQVKNNEAVFGNQILTRSQSLVDMLKTAKADVEDRISKQEKSQKYMGLQTNLKSCQEKIAPADAQIQKEIKELNNDIFSLNKQAKSYQPFSPPPFISTSLQSKKTELADQNSKLASLRAPCDKIQRGMDDEFRAHMDTLGNELKKIEANLTTANRDLLDANASANREANKQQQDRDISFGSQIIPQIEALEKLKAEDTAMWWTSTLIMAMFIAIETAPVLAKLLSKKGEYDYALETREIQRWLEFQSSTASKILMQNRHKEEEAAAIEQTKLRLESELAGLKEDLDSLRKTQIEINTKKQQKAMEKELASYAELVERISAAQKEIALLQVEQWRNEQLQKQSNSRT